MTLSAEWTAAGGRTDAQLANGNAHWQADLDPAAGGAGTMPTPHDLLDGALAACTVLTLQLYAKRKGYPLAGARAEIDRTEDGTHYRLARRLFLDGALSDEQRQDLLRIAERCPIHKALHKEFQIETTLA